MMPCNDPSGRGHHWRIGEAAGPLADGYCLKCGAEREFKTGWDGSWAGSDGIHQMLTSDKRNWAAEWLSDRQRDYWTW